MGRLHVERVVSLDWITVVNLISLALTLGDAQGQGPLFPLTAPIAGINGSLSGLGPGVSVGDFNNDGDPDIIASLPPFVAWVLGGSGGTYGPPTVFSLPPQTLGGFLSAGSDIDGDGNQDVVISYSSNNPPGVYVRLLLGNGQGQFTLGSTLPLPPGYYYYYGYALDVLPGAPAEVVLFSAMNTAPHYRNVSVWTYGSAGWTQLSSTGNTSSLAPWDIHAFGDVNGDGLADMVGTYGLSNGTQGGVNVVPGIPGPPYFGAPVNLPRLIQFATWNVLYYGVGDINNDGCDDIVLYDGGAPQGAYLLTALGNPQTVLGSSLSTGPAMPAAGTWGSLSPPTIVGGWIISATVSPNAIPFPSLLLDDFDGDGFKDVILKIDPIPSTTSYTNLDLHFHRGDGTGMFDSTPLVLTNTPYGFHSLLPIDADQDGDTDLVSWWTPTISVCFNQSNLGFGIAGSNGAPRLTSGLARPGNAAFQVALDNALPLSACFLGASLGQVTPVPASGIAIGLSPASLLWPPGALGPATTDALGQAVFPIPLPNTPSLAGIRAFVQWAVVDPLTPQGLALTPGRQIIIW